MKKSTTPPPTAISQNDMAELLRLAKEMHSSAKLAEMCNVAYSSIAQMIKRQIPVSARVALSLNFFRYKIGKEYWYEPIEGAESTVDSLALQKRAELGMPRIVRSSPLEGLPVVRTPGPFQQLFDTQGGAN